MKLARTKRHQTISPLHVKGICFPFLGPIKSFYPGRKGDVVFMWYRIRNTSQSLIIIDRHLRPWTDMSSCQKINTTNPNGCHCNWWRATKVDRFNVYTALFIQHLFRAVLVGFPWFLVLAFIAANTSSFLGMIVFWSLSIKNGSWLTLCPLMTISEKWNEVCYWLICACGYLVSYPTFSLPTQALEAKMKESGNETMAIHIFWNMTRISSIV